MLFLMRRVGESVRISGGITVTVLRIRGSSVRLGFQAPPEITVHRTELLAEAAHIEIRQSAARHALPDERYRVPERRHKVRRA